MRLVGRRGWRGSGLTRFRARRWRAGRLFGRCARRLASRFSHIVGFIETRTFEHHAGLSGNDTVDRLSGRWTHGKGILRHTLLAFERGPVRASVNVGGHLVRCVYRCESCGTHIGSPRRACMARTAAFPISGLRGLILRFARVGWTRFVSKTTYHRFKGSTQIEVPVNPVWPNASTLMQSPAEVYPVRLRVSQPIARLCTPGFTRCRHERMRSADTTRTPWSLTPSRNNILANAAISSIEANNPACPAVPPSVNAVSS